MSIITRKVVCTKDYRLLNLLKFIEEESVKATDVIWKVCVDVANHRIFVITRPFQVYAWDYNPYYQIVMDLIWAWWMDIRQRDTQSKSINTYWYILDDNSSKQFVSFKDSLESIPFIDDLFWIDYRVKYHLLTNLFLQCAESLIKEKSSSKTTSTSPTYAEQMASVYSELVVRSGNDMPQRWTISRPVIFDELNEIPDFSLRVSPYPTNHGDSNETSAGEISTNPF